MYIALGRGIRGLGKREGKGIWAMEIPRYVSVHMSPTGQASGSRHHQIDGIWNFLQRHLPSLIRHVDPCVHTMYHEHAQMMSVAHENQSRWGGSQHMGARVLYVHLKTCHTLTHSHMLYPAKLDITQKALLGMNGLIPKQKASHLCQHGS